MRTSLKGKWLNKISIGLAISSLLITQTAFANAPIALIYDADVIVSLSSPPVDLTILSGSKATVVNVNPGSVAVSMIEQDGSFTVTSQSRGLSVAITSFNITSPPVVTLTYKKTCVNGLTTVVLNGHGTATITPTDSQCNSGVVLQSGSSGGAVNDSTFGATKPFPFTDLDNHFAYGYVKTLWEMGVVNGRTPTLYVPDDSITRAEMLKIALLAFKYPIQTDLSPLKKFSDMNGAAPAWYDTYVATASAHDFVTGYEDGTFKPGAPISRAEALKILFKIANKTLGAEVDLPFTDVPANSWYKIFVDYAFDHGVVQGRAPTLFVPNGNITRGEMAKVTVKTLQLP